MEKGKAHTPPLFLTAWCTNCTHFHLWNCSEYSQTATQAAGNRVCSAQPGVQLKIGLCCYRENIEWILACLSPILMVRFPYSHQKEHRKAAIQARHSAKDRMILNKYLLSAP